MLTWLFSVTNCIEWEQPWSIGLGCGLHDRLSARFRRRLAGRSDGFFHGVCEERTVRVWELSCYIKLMDYGVN
jgi:hypothetical protein